MKVRLREQMSAYRQRTGEQVTYELLARKTGLSRFTLESLGSRNSYHATLDTVERTCLALGCTPGDLLEIEPTPVIVHGKNQVIAE